ncbi:flagellar basal body-associated FliL family protein [Marinococcus luteus]|uniref:flagellar basal body-associated FliL family protein n=1 Tax=Marinococcus luteus TaxID=1122204 RepID=UPI002ACC809E|nr:flagellar basal body-associated FliL family protein [Marinococcus luteus]MDZ5781817.1 flagellar basal body-associated FliL family protein [Marinococcus luteus]
MMIMLLTLVLIAGAAAAVYQFLGSSEQAEGSEEEKAEELSAEELRELTWDMDEMTTNLKGNDRYIKTMFSLQADNEKAREELEQRDYQINNIIIHELAQLEPGDIEGSEGTTEMEGRIREKVNEVMTEGKVQRVYTTERVIQ